MTGTAKDGQRIFVDFHRGAPNATHPKGVWIVTYKHANLQNTLGKPSCFGHDDLVRKLYERAADVRNLEAENLLEMGIRGGRGGFWIRLNPTEHARLCSTAKR